MEDFVLNITPQIAAVFLTNFILIIFLFIMNLSTKSNLKKLRKKYNRFMNGLSDRNMEQLLETCLEKVENISSKNKEFENHINNIDKNLLQCTQKVGVIRYNAFENVGSDLSFAVAFLDHNNNGVVLSGIYARDSSATYAKPIENGKSKYVLSAEEMQAIDIAKKNFGERLYS